MATKTLLVTDLDDTLWDWFAAWHASFSALLRGLERLSGVPASALEPEIRAIHQARGTSEYSNLVNELPALKGPAGNVEPAKFYDDALHAQNSARVKHTRLYQGVRESLMCLRERGIMIAAYTESVAYWTEWRIRHTGLDGVIDILYSAPDHDLPLGTTVDDLRTLPAENYGLKHTAHRHVPKGSVKPNVQVLRTILEDCDRAPADAVYVGDSLMKDIAMAQDAGVLDMHARYGESHQPEDYALLQRVSHWPDRDIAREQALAQSPEVVPSHVLAQQFGEATALLHAE